MVHWASGVVCFFLSSCLLLICSASPVPDTPWLAEGSSCKTKDGASGKCTVIESCPSELAKLSKEGFKYKYERCSFKGDDPVICCRTTNNTNQPPGRQMTRPVGRRAEEACRGFEFENNAFQVPYIFGGEDTTAGEFPHMVAVGYKKKIGPSGHDWLCGGALISHNYVLTAAHCVATSRGDPELVWVGAYNLSQTEVGRQYGIIGSVLHPNYTAKSNYYDIALLKVPEVLFDSAIFAACLYNKPREPKQVIVSGWGTYDEALSRMSDVLLKATLVSVPLSDCNVTYSTGAKSFSTRLARGIAPEMICARGANNISDTCQGDSGGPMQVRRARSGGLFDLVGVTSFGKTCGSIGVYVRVSSYIGWIESIVWPS